MKKPESKSYEISDGKVFRLLWDDTVKCLRLYPRNASDLNLVIDNFSVKNPAAFFVKQYGYSVPDTISAVNRFGYFQAGMIFEILKYIKLVYGSISVVEVDRDAAEEISRRVQPLRKKMESFDRETFEVLNVSEKMSMRDYQENIIKSIFFDGYGNGIFESPTSSGKSFTISNYIYTYLKKFDPNAKILILVPNRQLVDQFVKDMLEYGFSEETVCPYAGNVKKGKYSLERSSVIVSNRQYLFGNKDKLPKIDILVCDEVHTVKSGSSTADMINEIDPKMRVGCSGTIPKDNYERWNLNGIFGKILHSENIMDLQKRGFIAKLEIKRINVVDSFVKGNQELLFSENSRHKFTGDGYGNRFNEAWESETKYLTENFDRLYVPVLEKISELCGDRNILILFDVIKLGKDVFKAFTSLHPERKSHYIDGSIPVSEREKTRNDFESSKNNILFAQSATFSTGISIKNLPVIAFFFSGKSYSKVIQSIGRSLRMHKDKDVAVLFDVVFNFKYSKKHKAERDRIYKEAYGKTSVDEEIDIIVD